MYIIANGGMKLRNQENTIESILLTKHASYVDGVLVDIRLTLDNHLVAFKNDDISIDTLGKGFVSKMTYQDLRKVKFPSKIFRHYIPTLEEILKKYNSNKIIVLNLHDALDKNEILVDEVVKLLKKYSQYNYYLETSSVDVLDYLFEKANDYKIGPRLSFPPVESNYHVNFCDTLHDVSNKFVNTYSNILVHTVNEYNDLVNFLECVDINKRKDLLIISDYPKRLTLGVNQDNNL